MRTLITILSSLLFIGSALAQEHEYVGSSKCKSCHKKEEKGAQYKVWADSAHAKAFETLSSEKALKIAAEKKLALPPNQTPECLKCHTTGFGEGGYEIKDDAFYHPDKADKKGKAAAKRMTSLQSVSCEACHGAGSDYKGKKNMRAIFEGEISAEEHGLVVQNEKVCKACHNEESPTYQPFDYEEKKEEIAHSFPIELKKQKKK